MPQYKNGFKWNGHSVKELAGSGSIYIRLIKDCVRSHSDDDLLPPGSCAISNSFDNSQECNELSLHTTAFGNVPIESSTNNGSNAMAVTMVIISV